MSSSDESSEGLKRGVKRKRGISITFKPGNTTDSGPDSDLDSDSNNPHFEQDVDEATSQVEVLSHAAQRKLKKKAQKKEPILSLQVPVDLSKKRKNSIWVGNLAFKTSEQALRAFFQHGVPGCEVARVYLPKKTAQDVAKRGGMRGENCGFAYVDFATKEQAVKAVALSEQHLDGRKLLIKDGDDFTGRPSVVPGIPTFSVGKSGAARRILAAQKQPPAPTLFLGNLDFQTTEKSIREMIEGHLNTPTKEVEKEAKNTDSVKVKKILKKVRLSTFEDSGLCKGFAFLDFSTTEDATSVLLDPRNRHLNGRRLVLEYASADAVRRGGGPGAKTHRSKLDNRDKHDNDHRHSERLDWISKGKWESVETIQDEDKNPVPLKRQKREENRRHRGVYTGRLKARPGAALALAQRAKVAIVPFSGKRIVF